MAEILPIPRKTQYNQSTNDINLEIGTSCLTISSQN